MTGARHATRRIVRRSAGALGVLWIMVLGGAAPAQAACSAPVRADSQATQRVLEQMAARQAPGYEDARDLYERARRSCLDIRPARAIATATSQHGLVPAGRRARMLDVDLVSVPLGADTAWRLDLTRAATRVAGSNVAAERRQALATLNAASWGSAAVTWSSDPTRLTWDPVQQSAIVSILGRSTSPQLRARAQSGVRAYGVATRAQSLSRLPLLEQLRITARVDNGARAGTNPTVRAISRNLTMRAHARVRATQELGWSRIDGEWSTAPTHRTLVELAQGLLQRHPHPPTAAVVAQLAAALTSPPRVTFETLPTGDFYPWPRDGAFDEQAVGVAVDKPAVLTLLVYGPDGALVRTVATRTGPGSVTLTWDGARADGTIVEPGDYRYNIEARDPYANRIRVPGLEQFRVARDTTPPTIVSASMRVVGTGADRRAIVGWHVEEPHSPIVRSWLVLRDGDRQVSIKLHEQLQQATVRRALDLEAGSWRATIVFIDGSGNRSQRLLGTFQLR
jgi:hypothetical protein